MWIDTIISHRIQKDTIIFHAALLRYTSQFCCAHFRKKRETDNLCYFSKEKETWKPSFKLQEETEYLHTWMYAYKRHCLDKQLTASSGWTPKAREIETATQEQVFNVEHITQEKILHEDTVTITWSFFKLKLELLRGRPQFSRGYKFAEEMIKLYIL